MSPAPLDCVDIAKNLIDTVRRYLGDNSATEKRVKELLAEGYSPAVITESLAATFRDVRKNGA